MKADKRKVRMKLFSLILFLALTVGSFGQTCTTNVPPKITSAATATFTESVDASFTPTATGTPTPAISESGALPAGVTFASGKLSGTPAPGTKGTYSITFVAQNGTAPDANQTFSLVVLASQTTGGLWQPTSDAPIPWQWQLAPVPSANNLLNVQVYDIDAFGATTALVAAMHAKGMHVVCYVSAGTAEDFRSDYSSFSSAVKGKTNGWLGERWLDIRSDTLKPIMTARFQNCKNKGFDAVEPDNIDGFTNSTGFPLTAADQLAYNTWIANTVHSFGMSVALKNDGDQAKTLEPLFDFGLVEECARYKECQDFFPFRDNNKAVFAAEYQKNKQSQYCSTLNTDNFNGAIFDLDLTGSRIPCR